MEYGLGSITTVNKIISITTTTMRQAQVPVYTFLELNPKIQTKVIEEYYAHETYPLLGDELREEASALLESLGCDYSGLEVLYDLSYSQGSGLCFTGRIDYKGLSLTLTHNWRYYYDTSVDMYFEDEAGEEVGGEDARAKKLKAIYLDVCKTLLKLGYSTVEYRETPEEFAEIAKVNEWEYTQDGELFTTHTYVG